MTQAHNYDVLIIILCSLYDRLHIEGVPIIFPAIQIHHGEQCASEVSQLKETMPDY